MRPCRGDGHQAVTGMSSAAAAENAERKVARARKWTAPAAAVEQRRRRKPVGGTNRAEPSPTPSHRRPRDDAFYLPQVGVEVVDSDERNGHRFYTIRDLRNGHVINNVTRKGARKLWNYAIQQVEDNPVDPGQNPVAGRRGAWCASESGAPAKCATTWRCAKGQAAHLLRRHRRRHGRRLGAVCAGRVRENR